MDKGKVYGNIHYLWFALFCMIWISSRWPTGVMLGPVRGPGRSCPVISFKIRPASCISMRVSPLKSKFFWFSIRAKIRSSMINAPWLPGIGLEKLKVRWSCLPAIWVMSIQGICAKPLPVLSWLYA